MKLMRSVILSVLLIIQSHLSLAESGLIVNSKVPVATLTEKEFKNIFSGRVKRWENGTDVHIYILPLDSIGTRLFLIENLGLTISQFSDIIKTSESVGKKNIYVINDSEIDLIRAVVSDSGGIGYLKDTKFLVFGIKKIGIVHD